ncbi:glycosyltransferase 87 family protein [Streptomyces sp. AJS327]|uniref:glycosyltransferase 87 family protein n=1 Tax=Streptomyces sp. AJS327 TaxID=2545265 RepID=UPI0021559F00
MDGRVRRWPLALAFCLLSFAACWAAQHAARVSMIDLSVYRAGAAAARAGADLYALRFTPADLAMTYPPCAALLFAPLTLVDEAAARTCATVLNLLLLVVLVHLSLRLLHLPRRSHAPHSPGQRTPADPFGPSAGAAPSGPPASPDPSAPFLPADPAARIALTLALAGAAVWCEPVWTTLRYGQVNLLLTVLVLWDMTRRAGHPWAGAGTGLAAGVKLTPALFILLLAVSGAVRTARRRRAGHRRPPDPALRAAAVATATLVATVLLGAALLPRDSWHFWTRLLFDSGRVGHPVITDNQALSGVLTRLLHLPQPGTPWLAVAGLCALAGISVTVLAAVAEPERLPFASAWSTLGCAATALLISPISWSHHWVWCVPAGLLLAAEARRRASGRWWAGTAVTWALFCSYALWWVPHGQPGERAELHQGAGEMALSAGYAAAAVCFLTLTGSVALRAARSPASKHREPRRGAGPRADGPPQAVAKE